jgi:16S rRNA (uracil1498-N3)-methyltransferase
LVDVVERRVRPAESRIEMTLAQAVPKGAKMDFVVEKATELGVARIVPLLTERTLGDPSPGKLERWRRLARSAAQQSGRDRIPAIDEPLGIERFIAQARSMPMLLPWELAERVPLRERLGPLLAGADRIAVIIGPEGGLSHSEAEQAGVAGALVVSLGARILRSETAGLVVLSAVLYAAGEI